MGEIIPLRRTGYTAEIQELAQRLTPDPRRRPLTALDDYREALEVAERWAPDLANNLPRLQRLRCGAAAAPQRDDELALEALVDLLWWIAYREGER